MRRYILLLITCAVLLAALAACSFSKAGQSAEAETSSAETLPAPSEPEQLIEPGHDYRFPVNTKVFGIHIGRFTPAQACAAITPVLQDYVLNLDLNGIQMVFSGESLDLVCKEDSMLAYASALLNEEDPSEVPLISYDAKLLARRIKGRVDVPAVSTSIYYDEAQRMFTLSEDTYGSTVDIDMVMASIDYAIQNLRPTANLTVTEHTVSPEIPMDSTTAKMAVQKANSYLASQITYKFSKNDGTLVLHAVEMQDILSMIRYDESLAVWIDEEALDAYVNEINKLYGSLDVESQFITTAGELIDLPVIYATQHLDVPAFREDLIYSLEHSVCATRDVPYLDSIQMPDKPYSGSYIEIDKSSQTLWVYIDGECVIETPVVTGCPKNYWSTPTGVYSVLAKRISVILTGPDYESWVKYWMPFYRGYGMHDATWRRLDDFGGNEYLYNGSHGCVNIPPKTAEEIFYTIYTGIPVILYGGATYDNPVEQKITGTESYDVSIHTEPFALDAQLAYGDSTMVYASDNPSVVSVSSDGVVTIHKTGTANVSVVSHESDFYTSAVHKVQFTVTDPCGDNHTYGPWRVTTPPRCIDGERTKVCKICGKTERKPVTGNDPHCYGPWEITVKPGCKEGEEARSCIICGDTVSRVVAPTHNMKSWWNYLSDPTCTEPGERRNYCWDCDYYVKEEIPARGHDFDDNDQYCDDCDAENPNYIPPKEED